VQAIDRKGGGALADASILDASPRALRTAEGRPSARLDHLFLGLAITF
jgi:hypothetical protein